MEHKREPRWAIGTELQRLRGWSWMTIMVHSNQGKIRETNFNSNLLVKAASKVLAIGVDQLSIRKTKSAIRNSQQYFSLRVKISTFKSNLKAVYFNIVHLFPYWSSIHFSFSSMDVKTFLNRVPGSLSVTWLYTKSHKPSNITKLECLTVTC